MEVMGKDLLVKNKNKVIGGGIFILACIAVAVIYTTFGSNAKESESKTVSKETTVAKGNLTAGVTETGSISVGTLEQSYDLDLSTTSSSSSTNTSTGSTGTSSTGSTGTSGTPSVGTTGNAVSGTSSTTSTGSTTSQTSSSTSSALVVESVNASVGQVVAVGDLLYNLTDDSVNTVREKLTESRNSAQAALTQANLEKDNDLLEAKHTYETSTNEWNTAQTEYDMKIQELQDAVTSSQESLTAANQKVASLEAQITQMQTDYNAAVAEYNNSLALLNTVNKASDIVTYLNYETAANTAKDKADKLYSQWESLIDSYNTTKSSITNLTTAFNNAQTSQTTDSATALQDYQTKKLAAEKAQEVYNLAKEEINDTVESAQEDLDDAQEKLDAFETFVGDGGIYSEYAGTIMELGYESGSSLSSSTAIATFIDPSDVEVTVDVSEEDISVVTVGDTVNIVFSAYPDELYQGTVSGIASSVTDQQTSTVSYPVTVLVTGDVSKLYDGMTGDVTFITKEVDNVLYVSNKAITTEGTKSYVNKKDASGNVVKTEVTTGFSDGTNVEIQSGLTEGDVVLIESKVNNE